MGIYIKENGGWEYIKEPYIKDGGTWKLPDEGYIKEGGTWKLFYKNFDAEVTTNSPTNIEAETATLEGFIDGFSGLPSSAEAFFDIQQGTDIDQSSKTVIPVDTSSPGSNKTFTTSGNDATFTARIADANSNEVLVDGVSEFPEVLPGTQYTYVAYVVVDNQRIEENRVTFRTEPFEVNLVSFAPPDTGVDADEASLSGTIEKYDGYKEVEYGFIYKEDTISGSDVSFDPELATESEDNLVTESGDIITTQSTLFETVPADFVKSGDLLRSNFTGSFDFNEVIGGLKPDTTYGFVPYAKSGSAVFTSESPSSFETEPQDAQVSIESLVNLSDAEFNVNGKLTELDGYGQELPVYAFARYRTGTTWVNEQTTVGFTSESDVGTDFTIKVDNLTFDTTYEVQLVLVEEDDVNSTIIATSPIDTITTTNNQPASISVTLQTFDAANDFPTLSGSTNLYNADLGNVPSDERESAYIELEEVSGDNGTAVSIDLTNPDAFLNIESDAFYLFSEFDDSDNVFVPPGETVKVPITYNAGIDFDQETVEGTIDLNASSGSFIPNGVSNTQINVSATDTRPDLVVQDSFAFDSFFAGSSNSSETETVGVKNVGNETGYLDINIEHYGFGDTDFYASPSNTFLDPGEQKFIDVTFSPDPAEDERVPGSIEFSLENGRGGVETYPLEGKLDWGIVDAEFLAFYTLDLNQINDSSWDYDTPDDPTTNFFNEGGEAILGFGWSINSGTDDLRVIFDTGWGSEFIEEWRIEINSDRTTGWVDPSGDNRSGSQEDLFTASDADWLEPPPTSGFEFSTPRGQDGDTGDDNVRYRLVVEGEQGGFDTYESPEGDVT